MNELMPIPEFWGPLPRTASGLAKRDVIVVTPLELNQLSNFHRVSVGVIMAAYNEEKVITDSLTSLSRVFDPAHIYVVNDGSSDQTAELAGLLTPNVLNLKENVGKINALRVLIAHFDLLKRYDYLLFTDADSRLPADFLDKIKPAIKNHPACVVATVTSQRRGLISAFRTFEYGFSHRVFKRAQGVASLITIAPGCGSLYRTDILEQLDFSDRTLTEDFDLTLQIHLKKLGRIQYAYQARVSTQDPLTWRDYWRQVVRWYTGFWQNIRLHRSYLPTSAINGEIILSLVDSFSWFGALALAVLAPHTFFLLLLYAIVLVSGLGLLVLIMERQYWAIKYLPVFPVFQFINTAAYVYSFFRALKSREKLGWHKVARYAS